MKHINKQQARALSDKRITFFNSFLYFIISFILYFLFLIYLPLVELYIGQFDAQDAAAVCAGEPRVHHDHGVLRVAGLLGLLVRRDAL
jgi:hypothetical protein